MRLPHWLAHRWSRWTTYQYDAHRVGSTENFAQVRQWCECMACGKRRDELIREGPLGNAMPLAYDPTRGKKG